MSDTEKTPETEASTSADETVAAEDTSSAESATAADETAAGDPPAETAGEAEGAAEQEPEAAAAESEEVAEEAPAEAATDDESTGEAEATADGGAPEAAAKDAGGTETVHTYDELKSMTVAQMREIAEGLGEHDALHGYTTMHKEELLVALCKAQGIEAHEHHEVVGIDKSAVKAKIRELKQQRDALVASGNAKQLKIVRRRIRGLKRKIHKATV